MIVIDYLSQISGSGNGTLSQEHKISSSDSVLVVLAFEENGAINDTISVTFNGVTLTKIVNQTSNKDHAQIWYMINPPVGLYQLSISQSDLSSFFSFIGISVLGVDKRQSIPISFANTNASSNNPTLQVFAPTAGSLVIDALMAPGNGTLTPANPIQTLLGETSDGIEYGAGSFSNISSSDATLLWNMSAPPGSWAITAIVLEPANPYSTSFPSTGFRSQKDITNVNGLDFQTGTSRITKYGNFPSVFYKNSFLHTIGRQIPSAQNGPYGILSSENIQSTIIIHQIVQWNTNAGPSFNITIPSQDAVLVVLAIGYTASPGVITLDGAPISKIVNFSSTYDNFSDQDSFVIAYTATPPVGNRTLTVPSSGVVNVTAFVLLGVNKEKTTPLTYSTLFNSTGNFSKGNQATQTIYPDAANSLAIDLVNFKANANTAIPGENQIRITNFGIASNNLLSSYAVVGPGEETMSWRINGPGANWAGAVIVLEPKNAYSPWNSSVKLRNIQDIILPNALNVGNTPNFQLSGYLQSSFWQNSFLHTIGRMISPIDFKATLVAYYKFDEGIGLTTVDSSGSNHLGTFVNSPNWVTTPNRYGLQFNNGSYVNIADATDLRIVGDISFSFWVKLNTLNNINVVVSKNPNGFTAEYQIRINKDGTIQFTRGDGSANESAVISTATVPVGKLTHVGITCINQNVIFLINGGFAGAGTLTVAGVSLGSALTLGVQDQNFTNYLDGILDNLRIYSGGLQEAELQSIYLSEKVFDFFDNFIPDNFPGSFLHTVGRLLPPNPLIIGGSGNIPVTSQIIIDKVYQNQIGGGTTLSMDVNIPSQDAVLVVTGGSVIATGGAWQAVQFNGTSLINLGVATVVGADAEIWWLPNPPVGTGTLTIVPTAVTGQAYVNALVLLGVDKKSTNLVVSTATDAASTSTISSVITPNAPNALIIDAFSSLDATQRPTFDTSQIQLGNTTSINANEYVESTYKLATNAQEYSTYNLGAAVNAALVMVAFQPANAASIWFPNIDLRSLNDTVFSNNLQNGVNPVSGNYGYKPSNFLLNSFLHTIGRLAQPAPSTGGDDWPTFQRRGFWNWRF